MDTTRNDERAAAQGLANILSDVYGVRPAAGDIWEQYNRYVRFRWGLTYSEARVAVECLQGHTNDSIGEVLGLAVETVNKHLDAIYSKARVHGRSELAAVLLREVGRPE